MPPAVVAIGAAIATAAVTAFVESAIIAAILIAAINVAAILLTRRPSGKTSQGQEIKLKLDPTMPRQLVLGRAATGGSVVWAFTYGSSEKTPGGLYLVRIIALCDLPCSALVAVMEGKKQLQFDGDVTTGWRECINDHKTDKNNERMRLRVYLGSSSPTADSNLISWSGGQWTSAHKGTNMCYAAARYQYDTEGDAFPSGEPPLVFILDGVKCYDDRKDSSKPGGSGSHDLENPATWEFTRNTAILAAQSLRGFYSNGVLLFGAQAEERDLSTEMLFSAYNTCDQNVTYSGGTQRRYEAGIMVNSHEALANYLQEFQAAFDGRIIDRGGAITLLPGATRTPVFTLTDDDIVWSLEKSWQPKATLSELYNYVAGIFVDEDNVFAEKGYPPLRNASWETDDGGERLNLQVSFTAVTNWARVQRITKRIHEQSRYQGTVAFFLPLWGIEMEQGDWFTLTSERWDFEEKYFDAIQVDLVDTSHVLVIARETAPAIDGWDHSVDEKPRNDTTWNPPDVAMPIPVLTPTALYQANEAEGTEQFGVSIVISGIEVPEIIAPTAIEIQISPADDNHPITNLPTISAVHQTVTYFGLQPATAYSVRGRCTDGVAVTDWSAWVDFTTADAVFSVTVTMPPSITFAADNDGVVYPDLLPYDFAPEVKKGSTSVITANETSHSVEFVGCTGSVNNTNGDPDKGTITITNVISNEGYVRLTVTYNGVEQPAATTSIFKDIGAPGSGGEGGVFNTFNAISSTSHSQWSTELATITVGSGDTLYGTSGYIIYRISGIAVGQEKGLYAKFQYSPTGAGTWTDFDTEVLGWPSKQGGTIGGIWIPGNDGWFDPGMLDQQVSGLTPGDYDVRLVARLPTSGGTMTWIAGPAQVEAAP